MRSPWLWSLEKGSLNPGFFCYFSSPKKSTLKDGSDIAGWRPGELPGLLPSNRLILPKFVWVVDFLWDGTWWWCSRMSIDSFFGIFLPKLRLSLVVGWGFLNPSHERRLALRYICSLKVGTGEWGSLRSSQTMRSLKATLKRKVYVPLRGKCW